MKSHKPLGDHKKCLYLMKIELKGYVNAYTGNVLKPTVFIVGAQKAGTSALFSYLACHPDFYRPRRKELSFFDQEINFQKGEKWYHIFFPSQVGKEASALSLDATPEYMYYPQAMQRIRRYCSNAKIVILLRNPVERAYSAWNMYRNLSERGSMLDTKRWDYVDATNRLLSEKPFRDFQSVVVNEIANISSEIPEPGIVRRGIYVTQIERVYESFPKEQVLIIESTELRTETEKTVERVGSFIGLPSISWDVNTVKGTHKGSYQSKAIPSEASRLLNEFYAPHNEKLFNLLGRDFDWA
jgi:hypothetical protein